MLLIVLTGFLTGGLIPLIAFIGFGIELIINIFIPVEWGYWENVAVGFLFLILPGVVFYTKKEDHSS